MTSAPTLLPTRVGAWSMRAGVYEPARWAELARAVGLTDVSLCAADQQHAGAFRPFLPAAALAQRCREYTARGLAVHVMLWPRPERAFTGDMLDYVAELYAALPELASIDLDAEEQWTRSGYLQAHGAHVATQIRAGWPEGLPLALNGITAALPKILDLVNVADILWPQAYTSTKRGQTSTPGERQLVVARRWREVATRGQRVHMGLAAYAQEGAGGLSATTAMQRAWDAAASVATEIRYWSLQDLAGGTDAAFVRARCAELRR